MSTVKFRVVLLLTAAAILALFGCSSILEGETMSISAHIGPSATASDGVMEAETYGEMKDCILSFICSRCDKGIFRVYSYEGDVPADVDRACADITKNDPIGAYAVSEMIGTIKQIVSYYEVEVYIAYNDVPKEQLDSIITVSTARELDNSLKFALAEYAPSLTVLAYGTGLMEDEAVEFVSRIYYDNPGQLVMLPVTTVDFYPKYATDRIIDFTFGYRYEASTLEAMEQSLNDSIHDMTESVIGSGNGQALLTLAERLMESTEYDEEMAASGGGDYSNQNLSATAYSALISGKAVSEGYAMAYKALCDKLGIECFVVIGKHAGELHAWNIVQLEDDYYHIDVSRCDLIGLEAAFLKNDKEMENEYEWDTGKYKVCDGPLSYYALATGSAEASAD